MCFSHRPFKMCMFVHRTRNIYVHIHTYINIHCTTSRNQPTGWEVCRVYSRIAPIANRCKVINKFWRIWVAHLLPPRKGRPSTVAEIRPRAYARVRVQSTARQYADCYNLNDASGCGARKASTKLAQWLTATTTTAAMAKGGGVVGRRGD